MHWQRGALGKPGGERDTGSLAAGDSIEAFIADIIHDHCPAIIHHLRAHPRKSDDLAAVDIDRTLHARGQGERIIGAEQHRPDLKQHPRHRTGDGGFVISVVSILRHVAPPSAAGY